ncbi:hypothetical protein SAY87_027719 [Trapa incisa]|uniref:Uncharacterized protein n=1 Tax=Trapa incisa TaxID=236973 RepID=A0AAN7JMX5_9MYRT|nr:hypothetical protein SAY87_027719 [Trapa incisa]
MGFRQPPRSGLRDQHGDALELPSAQILRCEAPAWRRGAGDRSGLLNLLGGLQGVRSAEVAPPLRAHVPCHVHRSVVEVALHLSNLPDGTDRRRRNSDSRAGSAAASTVI